MDKKSKSTGTSARAALRKVPPRAQARGMDLSAIFNVATQALAANQSSLNQADTENQNHGDNMVQAFTMISQALASQQGAAPSSQLQHASQVLTQNAHSGSGQAYAQGLAQAAQQFQGQSAVTPDNAMLLVQSLLGGGQQSAPQAGTDLLGGLLGGGGQGGASQAGDLLGTLLGGGQTAPQAGGQQPDGIDLGDVLNAGLTFMNAKQQGQDNLQAALTALMSAGPLGQKPHRQQSGQVVANALLQAISGMANRK
ncbi:MAG: DAK2 domain-containing protein [Anaerolineales bacterium]